MSNPENKTPDENIEDGISEIYRGLFRLQEAGRHDEAFAAMTTIMNMMKEDREIMIAQGKVER